MDPYTYIIPFRDQYVIYQPLNRLAFAGNAAMADMVRDLKDGKEPEQMDDPMMSFLSETGFFTSASQPAAPPDETVYLPTIAVLCPTNACNLGCLYCFADAGTQKRVYLPPETGTAAIDMVYRNAKSRGAGQFGLSFHGGGEPTLAFRQMKRFTQFAREKDLPCRVELTSNGYWGEHTADWILSNIDHLTLSFDGPPEVQNRQRPLAGGGETFPVLLNTIRRLDDAGLQYGIRMTVTRDSIALLPESIAWLCRHTRCTVFQVEPAFGAGRALSNRQTLKQTGRFIREFLTAWDIARESGRELTYSGARPGVITDRFCLAHDRALVVTPDGTLSSCYEISGPDHPLADLFHFGTLRPDDPGTGISMEKRQAFQAKINDRKKGCRDCFCFWHCAGDCPAKTIRPGTFENNAFGDRCRINREITLALLVRFMSDQGGIYNGKTRETFA